MEKRWVEVRTGKRGTEFSEEHWMLLCKVGIKVRNLN